MEKTLKKFLLSSLCALFIYLYFFIIFIVLVGTQSNGISLNWISPLFGFCFFFAIFLGLILKSLVGSSIARYIIYSVGVLALFTAIIF